MGYAPGESGNPRGRPKGAKNKRTMARTAVKKTFGSEEKFWQTIAKQAKDGDRWSIKELANRLEPPLKPQSQTIKLNLPDYAKMEDLAPVVMEAIADGEIPPDEGSNLMTALLNGSKLEKLAELESKVDQLLAGKHG